MCYLDWFPDWYYSEKSRQAASSDQISELQKELAAAKHRIEESVVQKQRLDAEVVLFNLLSYHFRLVLNHAELIVAAT